MSAETPTDIAGLAAIINSRLAAQSRVAKALAFGWTCAGLSALTLFWACGLFLALYGYSHMISVQPSADLVARALQDAFERAKIKAMVSGRMALSPNSEIKLAAGQTVKLQDGSAVSLAPNSVVQVRGGLTPPRPSARQLQPGLKAGNKLPFTSYTIFRSISFGNGRVETGWNYDLSDTTKPRGQFCSYIQNVTADARVKDTIAVDGVQITPPLSARASFDRTAAFSRCVWFTGL